MTEAAAVPKNSLLIGLSEEALVGIQADSVSLSFWSPPYFVGKEYEKNVTYADWQKMLQCVIECHTQILKPGGFMVINMADILCFPDRQIPRWQAENRRLRKYAITRQQVVETMAQNPGADRYQIAAILGCSEQTIDRRLNGNNIRGGKHQTETRVKLTGGDLEAYAYEVGLYLYDRRIWAKDPAWANSRWTTNTLKAVSEFEDIYVFWKPGPQVINRGRLTDAEWREWGMRGIWSIPSVRSNTNHPAKFPHELARRVICLYTDPGDLVVDPFVGSGTTILAAKEAGRAYIGIDKNAEYIRLAAQNLRDLDESLSTTRVMDRFEEAE